MDKMSPLSALFEADEDPSITSYREAVNYIILHPRRIQLFANDSLKLLITTRSRRFTELFALLESSLPDPKSPNTRDIAASTAELLSGLLPDLNELLGTVELIGPLAVALRICIAPSHPVDLRQLATVLCKTGNVLEHLVAHPVGSEIVNQWCTFPRTIAHDASTRRTWTERFVNMVLSCIGDHNIAPAIQKWKELKALQKALRLLGLKLSREEGNNNSGLEALQDLLTKFKLPLPKSIRLVQSHIEYLSNEATISTLQSVVSSMPCKLCITYLGFPPRPIIEETSDRPIETFSELPLDILGKNPGIWKVLISAEALDHVQKLSTENLFRPVREKLDKLFSGQISFAPSECVQDSRVPLVIINCGEEHSMLCQRSVGTAGEKQALQQIVVVWEVGDTNAISKALKSVAVLERSYTREKVECCLRTPRMVDGRSIPATFNNNLLKSVQPEKTSAELDISIVDQGTIQLASKFYALTAPVMRSIIAKNLTAEFPVDLSSDEARCVCWVKSSSFIIGRSGTGKTTCLILKLVGKFLASKMMASERPLRQASLIMCHL